MKTSITIAGSDSSGGAGIQADLKTFTAHGVFGMSAMTAITSQNTLGVNEVFDVPAKTVASQLDAVFTDIFPDSVKIGMVSNIENIKTISEKLKEYNARNIVLDTVMVSTSGHLLLQDNAVNALCKYLFPIADIITPNLYEAQILCGFSINSENDMLIAAKRIYQNYGTKVLIKGGHLFDCSNDLLYDGTTNWFEGAHINNSNTHGTGCTLSSAIAANLALGFNLPDAVKKAKSYITGALNDMLDLGNGSGPLNHMYKYFPSN